jgi:hypothetical protein
MTVARTEFKPQSRVFRDGLVQLSLDGRSRFGSYLRALRAELIEHVAGPGGRPGVVQAQLIELAVNDAHQLALFSERVLGAGKLTPRERREESAVRGRYEKTLGKLGLKPVAARQPTLAEVLAAGQAA